ncbi:MAG: class I SAM-dependent methyltransferase [Rickettsiaceae bacterium]|nr:class I SAM-dependent methyltransferase [Rickettsiaceae bacterium]
MTQDYSYDQVNYESYPYPQSSPIHLRTIGGVFGLNAPDLANARILELGCAAGGNIIPFAYMYPNSKCVGVELSKNQVEQGTNLIEKLGIKNIELKHMSITDIDESFGEFDYIIAHGVFSWVPRLVQDKILEICSKNLSKNGIAYISYNTLPGWNMIKSIREMMLYHSQGFSDEREKVVQARLLLQFIKDATVDNNSAYSKLLQTEAEMLAQQPDHYIRHDHMEDDNHPCYFHDFMARANEIGLQYLGDSSLPSMYLGNIPNKAAEKLAEIKDIVRSEQYMDYVTNRRFRSTLLCKSDIVLNRNLVHTDIEKFFITANITPEKPISDINLESNIDTAKFYAYNSKDQMISTASPPMKAIFYALAENSCKMLKTDEIVALAAKKLKNVTAQQIKQEFLANGLKLVLAGYLGIKLDGPAYKSEPSQKPKVSELVRAQCEYMPGLWVTNLKHERIGINLLDKVAFRYFDGKHTLEEVRSKVLERILLGELSINKNEQKLEDKDEITKELTTIFGFLEERLRNAAILE